MSAGLCVLKHLHRINDIARCVSADIVVTVPVVKHRLRLPAHRIGDSLYPCSVCKLDNINQVRIVCNTIEEFAVCLAPLPCSRRMSRDRDSRYQSPRLVINKDVVTVDAQKMIGQSVKAKLPNRIRIPACVCEIDSADIGQIRGIQNDNRPVTLHRADVDALATGRLLIALMHDKERVRKAKRNSRMAKDFEFDIIEHIGVLAEKSKGWKREINLISWGGAEPKIDIRDWSPDHSKMGKGISLSREEIEKLKELV